MIVGYWGNTEMTKYKSETFRYGDTNPDHVEAIGRVLDFWEKYAGKKYRFWIKDTDWVEHYSLPFIRDKKLDRGNRDHFEHTADITFFEWMQDQPIPQLIIEIDGQSHDSISRKIADGIFQEWIKQKYKGMCKLIRIQKRELVGDLDLAHEHLRNVLGEYLNK